MSSAGKKRQSLPKQSPNGGVSPSDFKFLRAAVSTRVDRSGGGGGGGGSLRGEAQGRSGDRGRNGGDSGLASYVRDDWAAAFGARQVRNRLMAAAAAGGRR